MEINNYETHGRKLLVEFKCYRCETTVTRPLEACMQEQKECHQDLYDLAPPKDWRDGGFYYPTFCPKCAEAYKKFMNNEEGG